MRAVHPQMPLQSDVDSSIDQLQNWWCLYKIAEKEENKDISYYQLYH